MAFFITYNGGPGWFFLYLTAYSKNKRQAYRI